MQKYIKIPCNITISGSNGQGKTFLINNIIKTFFDKIDVLIIVSNTANFNKDYDSVINKLKKYPSNFDPESKKKVYIINPLFHEQLIRKVMTLQKKNASKRSRLPTIFIIFDDIAGNVKDSKILQSFSTQNRHYNTTIIFSVQYINLAAAFLREISNYDIIFSLKNENSYKACYENYFVNEFNTYAEFKKKFVNLLNQYEFIFCDRINNLRKIMKCTSLKSKVGF